MPYDVRLMESAWLAGLAKFEALRRKQEAEFAKPIVVDLARQVLESMGPEQLAMLQAKDPAMFDRLMRRVGGG
jgi:hypothetical protein